METQRRRSMVTVFSFLFILVISIIVAIAYVTRQHNHIRVNNLPTENQTTVALTGNLMSTMEKSNLTHRKPMMTSNNNNTMENSGSCSLDMSLDMNLMYITAPIINNANKGFAMDKACKNGDHCVYACEAPYVSTINGWSDDDCVPYLGRCDKVYNPSTYTGGLYCNNNSEIEVAHPNVPLCMLGLNTSYIKSNVPQTISSCQTVYPGNEAPMIGLEIHANEMKQITSFPQNYWQQTHAHFYVTIASEKSRAEACQWNYDPLSLNSGGVDTMPYIVGGGALKDNACKECGQHNMDFGENFDYNKSYSAIPTFGIRARNCNDHKCGKVLCDATYRYNNDTQQLERYWVKYNTVYGADNVGCVTDAVAGNSWDGNVENVNKYTMFEYYNIDSTTGNDLNCATNGIGCFDHTTCSKLVDSKNASYGTGKNPSMYVCTPVDGAKNFQLSFKQANDNVVRVNSTSTQTLYTVGIVGCMVLLIAGFTARKFQENKRRQAHQRFIVQLSADTTTETPYMMA